MPPAPEHVCDISGLMAIVFEMMDDNCSCVDDGIFVDDGVCDDNGVLMMVVVLMIMIFVVMMIL